MGLWYHKQKCKQTPYTNNVVSSPDITNEIMENFKKLQEQIASIAPSNINSNNTVNIHLTYLNTHCNNAMNIDQFVESIQFIKDDMMEIDKNRFFLNGAINVLKTKLANLSVEAYPIHCSAVERNQPTNFYVRDNDQWTQESHSDIEYQIKYGDFDETEEGKPRMMRFLEKYTQEFYDEYIRVSKKDTSVKRIDDKMSICGQSKTHIEMLREIPDIESVVLENSNADTTLSLSGGAFSLPTTNCECDFVTGSV